MTDIAHRQINQKITKYSKLKKDHLLCILDILDIEILICGKQHVNVMTF